MRALTMPQDKSPNPWMKTRLRVEMQDDGGARNYSHRSTASAVLAADLVYPTDLFVPLQRFADDLGLDRDCDPYDTWADERGGRGSPLPSLLGGEEGRRVLGGCLSPEGRVGIYEPDTRQSKWMLRRVAGRDWRDVVSIRDARGTHKIKSERDLWEAMDGMSDLSVSGSDVGEYLSGADEEMGLRVATNGVSKLKLSGRRCRRKQK